MTITRRKFLKICAGTGAVIGTTGTLPKIARAQKKPSLLRLACIADMTGPYAAIVGTAHNAFVDACQYVNERGGIKGVPLEPVVFDCGGKIDLAVSQYMHIREMKPRPLVTFTIISAVGEALHDRYVEDKMMGINVASAEAIYPKANTFGWYPIYSDQFGLFCDWLKETWKEPRPPKLAFVTWDTTYGKAVLYPECYEYAKAKGIEIVTTELFTPRDIDLTTHITRCRNKGADWVFSNTAGSGPVPILKAIKEIGWKDVKYCGGGVGYCWSTMYIAPAEFEGAYGLMPWYGWDEPEQPGIKTITDYFKVKGRSPVKDRTVTYLFVWFYNVLLQDVISKAVDAVGWDKLSSLAIKEQMFKVKDYSPLGCMPLTFTKDRMAPTKARVMQVKGGKILPLTDFRECPDIRPAKFR